jgi:uncharacterized membrane protein
MTDTWIVILALTIATFAIRLAGVLVGRRLPSGGRWSRMLNALPGCLIVSLVSVSLFTGGPREWGAGAIAAATAIVTRNLPVTMAAGILAVYALRHAV